MVRENAALQLPADSPGGCLDQNIFLMTNSAAAVRSAAPSAFSGVEKHLNSTSG